MNKQPVLSFIIPAYNAADTIEVCINSILKIKLTNIEVIVVNDGSKDHTELLCKNIIDKRIRVISQENQGVSCARNRGIAEAEGKYLMFVDADDIVQAENIEKIISEEMSDDVIYDIIMYGVFRNINGNILEEKKPLKPGIYSKDKLNFLQEKMLSVPIYKKYGKDVLQGSAWRYLFLREKIQKDNIEFCKDIPYCEDLCFCLEVFSKCKNIKVTAYNAYTVNVTQNSASRSYRENIWGELQKVYSEICMILEEEKEELYYYYGKSAINHYIFYLDIKSSINKVDSILLDSRFQKSARNIKGKKKVFREHIEDFMYMHRMVYAVVVYRKLYLYSMKVGSFVKQKIRRLSRNI